MAELLPIDGGYATGGGLLVRNAVSLAALTGRAIRIDNMRAGRSSAGLGASHLAAIRAAAKICEAHMVGDSIASRTLTFIPRIRPKAGKYTFDAIGTRSGGTSGSATLVLQTVMLPLARASGTSNVRVTGGTHVPDSPTFDFLTDAWLPLLQNAGIRATLTLKSPGWLPRVEGQIDAEIFGPTPTLQALDADDRGAFRRVFGRAIASGLPAHVPQRITERARQALRPLSLRPAIVPELVRASAPGAALFVGVEYERARAGFTALGDETRAYETVADEAVAALLAHDKTGVSLDPHLANQVMLPLALARAPSTFSAAEATPAIKANAGLLERFGLAKVAIRDRPSGGIQVQIAPAAG